MAGGHSLSQQLRAPGGPHTGQDALPSQGHSHTRHSLRLGQCRHAIHLTATFGMWEEAGVLGENPPDMGRMGKLHTDGGPGQESIIFSSTV